MNWITLLTTKQTYKKIILELKIGNKTEFSELQLVAKKIGLADSCGSLENYTACFEIIIQPPHEIS